MILSGRSTKYSHYLRSGKKIVAENEMIKKSNPKKKSKGKRSVSNIFNKIKVFKNFLQENFF